MRHSSQLVLGGFQGSGYERALSPLGETGQEMNEIFWGRFSVWTDGGLGDAEEIEVD